MIGNYGQLKDNTGKFTANFDVNYTPVSANYPASTPAQVVVQAGDTLRTIALRAYGDTSLWYLIADENGLSDPDAILQIGIVLKIPNQVISLANDSGTYKPFNPVAVLGNTTPTLLGPPAVFRFVAPPPSTPVYDLSIIPPGTVFPNPNMTDKAKWEWYYYTYIFDQKSYGQQVAGNNMGPGELYGQKSLEPDPYTVNQLAINQLGGSNWMDDVPFFFTQQEQLEAQVQAQAHSTYQSDNNSSALTPELQAAQLDLRISIANLSAKINNLTSSNNLFSGLQPFNWNATASAATSPEVGSAAGSGFGSNWQDAFGISNASSSMIGNGAVDLSFSAPIVTPNEQRTITVGKEGAQGLWGVAASIAGIGASNADIKRTQLQLESANLGKSVLHIGDVLNLGNGSISAQGLTQDARLDAEYQLNIQKQREAAAADHNEALPIQNNITGGLQSLTDGEIGSALLRSYGYGSTSGKDSIYGNAEIRATPSSNPNDAVFYAYLTNNNPVGVGLTETLALNIATDHDNWTPQQKVAIYNAGVAADGIALSFGSAYAGGPAFTGTQNGVRLDQTDTRAINSLSPVLEFDATGNEVMYRSMTPEQARVFERTGRIPATGETSVSPLRSYAEQYDGVTYQITVKPGTSAQLQNIGVAANEATSVQFPDLSTQTGSWNQTNARFKVESGQTTTQLGRGVALDIFNLNIIDYQVVRSNRVTR